VGGRKQALDTVVTARPQQRPGAGSAARRPAAKLLQTCHAVLSGCNGAAICTLGTPTRAAAASTTPPHPTPTTHGQVKVLAVLAILGAHLDRPAQRCGSRRLSGHRRAASGASPGHARSLRHPTDHHQPDPAADLVERAAARGRIALRCATPALKLLCALRAISAAGDRWGWVGGRAGTAGADGAGSSGEQSRGEVMRWFD
jgi:hypothetical protein